MVIIQYSRHTYLIQIWNTFNAHVGNVPFMLTTRQCFRERVCDVVIRSDLAKRYFLLLHIVSYQVSLPQYVSRFIARLWLFGLEDGTTIITVIGSFELGTTVSPCKT